MHLSWNASCAFPFPLKAEALASLGLRVNPGQPLVVAFADALTLQESPMLESDPRRATRFSGVRRYC